MIKRLCRKLILSYPFNQFCFLIPMHLSYTVHLLFKTILRIFVPYEKAWWIHLGLTIATWHHRVALRVFTCKYVIHTEQDVQIVFTVIKWQVNLSGKVLLKLCNSFKSIIYFFIYFIYWRTYSYTWMAVKNAVESHLAFESHSRVRALTWFHFH